MNLIKWWREILIGVLLVALIAVVSYKENTVKEITIEKIVEVKVKEYIEVKQEQKQVVVRKTTKTPDGKEVIDERIQTETKEETKTDKQSETKEVVRSSEVSTVVQAKRYQLGLAVAPSASVTEFSLSGGMRLFGPLFATGAVNFNITKPLSPPKIWLGVSYEF